MHPIRVSPNKRYFVDTDGNHVLWMGTTQWQLLRAFTIDEARLTVQKSKRTGFDFIQAMPLRVDPRRNDSLTSGPYSSSGTATYTTPEGWQDAFLFVEASA